MKGEAQLQTDYQKIDVMNESYTKEQYKKAFIESDKGEKALEHALDIRKFEIELYWKRAAYFWTFIGATFAGYVAIQTATDAGIKQDLSVILSCLGIVFSIAWVCVNKGSKQWQENWENHVDMLEDCVTGPLYKVVLTRCDPKGRKETLGHWLTGPSPFSVSKINQIISLYISVLWLCLLIHSLFSPSLALDRISGILHLAAIVMSAITCVLFFTHGRTYGGKFWHKATIRTVEMKDC